MDKDKKQSLIDRSVNLFLYNLRCFDEFANLEPRQLNLKCDALKSDQDCVVISIETPKTPDGLYLHFISQNSSKGIMNFMISSCLTPKSVDNANK